MFFKFLLNTTYLPKYYDNKVFIKGKYVSLCDYLRFKKLQFYQFNFISKKRKTCKGMKSVHVQQIWFHNKFFVNDYWRRRIQNKIGMANSPLSLSLPFPTSLQRDFCIQDSKKGRSENLHYS